jgi:hypothetical protein
MTSTADGTHSFAEQHARDFEPGGNARIALDAHGTPARSRASVRRLAVVTSVESLPGFRTRLTLDTGRTITMQDTRWVLAEYSAWRTGVLA